MRRLEIPREHYEGLGRVTVAASKLEAMAAQCAAAALGLSEEAWVGMLGNSGQAMKRLNAAAAAVPEVPDLKTLHDDIRAKLDERNVFVHSIVYFDPTAVDANGSNWVLHHPKSGKDVTMPTPAELIELASQMNAISARAIGVLNDAMAFHAAVFLRPEETP